MGQAHYYSGTDRSIGDGTYNFYFNPTGDSLHATVTNVAYKFKIDYAGGKEVDLGDIDIYLYSPDGERHTIYYNFDGFGNDNDDHNDSDSANDYDIYFDGSGGESTFSSAFDGDPVNGNWRLRIDNDTGKTLTMYYFESWVDFKTAPDMIVENIEISGDRALGEKVKIEATLKNIGETDYLGIGKDFDVEYYVNGKLVGTDSVTYGLNSGQSNKESFSYTVEDAGTQNIEVKVKGISGEADTANNSKSTSFWAEAPDLVVKDIQVFGDVKTGQEVEIEALLANIGGADYGGLLDGGFDLEYYVEQTNGSAKLIGTDSVSFGLTAGQENSESIKYTLESGDTGEFTVKIVDTEGELNATNNSRTEWAGEANQATHSVADSLEHVKIGTLFARAVYGETNIDADYAGSEDNGLSDSYDTYFATLGWTVLDDGDLGNHFVPDEDARFNAGGLFEGKADALLPDWDAQSILAEGETSDGAKTLVLSFRGTDDEWAAVVNGQAFTGDGLYHHYNAHKPLIEAALSYANDPQNGIEKLIVSGHSLGGSMADIFASVDAQRLRDDIDLTVVSLASAGVDETVYTHTELFDGFETQHDYDVVEVDGESIELTAADHYIGISHHEDAVTFAERVDLDTIDGYVGNNILRNNENFDSAITQLYLPNLDNSEMGDDSLFSKGFGAEHDIGLYWAHLSMLADDELAGFYTGDQKLIYGLTDYDKVLDMDGSVLPVFQDYSRLNKDGYDNDSGAAALTGDGAQDFILGLSGDDAIFGYGGNDLLSGGLGKDSIEAGGGDDHIAAGEGNDAVDGGAGADTAWLGAGDDLYADHATDVGRDTVYGGAGADVISTGAGKDRLSGGNGGDSLNGGGGKDKIFGGRGADEIAGGGGRDKIEGGKGRDTITGGGSADVFIFDTDMSKDRITDYKAGKDALHLSDGLWADGLSAQDLIDTVASVKSSGVVMDFGDGDKLILEGLTTTDGLADDLVLV